MGMINAFGEALLSHPTVVMGLALAGFAAFVVLCVKINVSDRLTAARVRSSLPAEALDRLTSSLGRVVMHGEREPVDLNAFVNEARVSGAPLEPGKSPAYRDNSARTDGDDDGQAQRGETPLRGQGAEDGGHGPARSVHPSGRPLTF